MRAITELAPLAIAIAVIGVVTWYLLDRDIGLGKWLLAALLFAHGWVHLMFVFPQAEAASATAGGLAYPFDMGRSWLITALGLDGALVRTIGLVIMVSVVALSMLAALSTIGVLIPATWWAGLVIGSATWWAGLVIGSAISSTLLLALFFSPALLLGFAISLALLWLVLGSVWSPTRGIGGIG